MWNYSARKKNVEKFCPGRKLLVRFPLQTFSSTLKPNKMKCTIQNTGKTPLKGQ